MEENYKFPDGYQPLDRLLLCSNLFIGGTNLVLIDGEVPIAPIIFGNGDLPMIWLYQRIDDSTVIALVSQSVSNNPDVSVDLDYAEHKVTIRYRNTVLVSARMTNDAKGKICIVKQMDLRPSGTQIFGNEKTLRAAASQLTNNRFSGSKFAILGLFTKPTV